MAQESGIAWTKKTWNPCKKAAGHLLDGVEYFNFPEVKVYAK